MAGFLVSNVIQETREETEKAFKPDVRKLIANG